MNNGFNIKQARWSFIKTVFNYAEIMKQFFIFYFLWTFLKVIYNTDLYFNFTLAQNGEQWFELILKACM